MGREVRMVPADWVHPVYDENNASRDTQIGRPIPLIDGNYETVALEWDEARAQWIAGFVETYSEGATWKPKEAHHTGRYTDYAGSRPSPDDYMPSWPAEQRTHLMMYENTSEGTPLSPAFATPEELARWLADNGASSFGDSTATYEQWLAVAKGGWAPSMVIENGRMMSGVEALSAA